MLPFEYAALDSRDKAFIIAAIEIKAEEEKKEAKKARKGR